MAVTEYFGKGTTRFSFEVTPPKRGRGIQSVFQAVDMLMPFNPAFIDVTYHQPQIMNSSDGAGVNVYERPGTLAIGTAIKYKYKVEAVPHVICGGFTAEETEGVLVGMHYLGLDSVLAIRGDPPKGQKEFIPKDGGHTNALGLVKQIKNMNRGIYLHNGSEKMEPTNFCIGVAGYPEKHPEAESMEKDLRYLKEKVDAGADYIVTQMFFDVEAYRSFVRACRDFGISVPIVPGMKVLDRAEQLEILPEIFGCKIPDSLSMEVMRNRDSSEAVKEAGISHAVRMCEELMSSGVPDLHFYVLKDAGPVAEVMRRLDRK